MATTLRSHVRAIASGAIVIALATSCSSGGPPTSTPTPVATDAAESTSPTSTEAAVPDELLGEWEAVISTGEEVTLTLGHGSYQVRRGEFPGAGSIAVDGTTITFRSPLCEAGAGSYEWSIKEDGLTFVPLEPRDPCGQRIIFLEEAAYTRVE